MQQIVKRIKSCTLRRISTPFSFNGSERFLLFSKNIFERFTCSRARNKTDRNGPKKKLNSIQFFCTVADRFRTLFFHSFVSVLLYSTIFLLYRFYYILLKTVPYRSDPFQMDFAYWIRTHSLNRTVPNR